jgi:hypothetical protein
MLKQEVRFVNKLNFILECNYNDCTHEKQNIRFLPFLTHLLGSIPHLRPPIKLHHQPHKPALSSCYHLTTAAMVTVRFSIKCQFWPGRFQCLSLFSRCEKHVRAPPFAKTQLSTHLLQMQPIMFPTNFCWHIPQNQ